MGPRDDTTGRGTFYQPVTALPTEFGSLHNILQCMILYIVLLFMSLQNSVGPYNIGTLYRSVERIVGHSVTWVCDLDLL